MSENTKESPDFHKLADQIRPELIKTWTENQIPSLAFESMAHGIIVTVVGSDCDLGQAIEASDREWQEKFKGADPVLESYSLGDYLPDVLIGSALPDLMEYIHVRIRGIVASKYMRVGSLRLHATGNMDGISLAIVCLVHERMA